MGASGDANAQDLERKITSGTSQVCALAALFNNDVFSYTTSLAQTGRRRYDLTALRLDGALPRLSRCINTICLRSK